MKFRVVYKTFQLSVAVMPENEFRVLRKCKMLAHILKNVSVGDVVSLSGFLVDVSRADGWRWTSSLSREDSGGGACELLWVESARVR